ncbi:uncharacterized protein CLUP02_11447 [Colletotrichum lupini]|uniref:Uncharacterized protein n=1 Tax=Colletotrichum lupini TaxID=145971 RepID=A0A9Q8SYM4_9PEZI|nr:uncharacterized protein CLUP02_11447 [Colletotrichum lupini]UQC85948.1 hypothetical protein CLUP02_11447 [Colletotrichum lupini]
MLIIDSRSILTSDAASLQSRDYNVLMFLFLFPSHAGPAFDVVQLHFQMAPVFPFDVPVLLPSTDTTFLTSFVQHRQLGREPTICLASVKSPHYETSSFRVAASDGALNLLALGQCNFTESVPLYSSIHLSNNHLSPSEANVPSSAALPIGFYLPLSILTLVNTIKCSRRSCHTLLGLFYHPHWAAMHLLTFVPSKLRNSASTRGLGHGRSPSRRPVLPSIWLLRKRHDSSALLNSNRSLALTQGPALKQSLTPLLRKRWIDTFVPWHLFVALLDHDILTETHHLMLSVEVAWLMSKSSHTQPLCFTALVRCTDTVETEASRTALGVILSRFTEILTMKDNFEAATTIIRISGATD